MTKTQALKAIYGLLDGTEWSADTLEAIAAVLAEAGYTLHNFEEAEENKS